MAKIEKNVENQCKINENSSNMTMNKVLLEQIMLFKTNYKTWLCVLILVYPKILIVDVGYRCFFQFFSHFSVHKSPSISIFVQFLVFSHIFFAYLQFVISYPNKQVSTTVWYKLNCIVLVKCIFVIHCVSTKKNLVFFLFCFI